MEANALETIKGQLQDHKNRTAAAAASLRIELADFDTELARVDAALAALSGTATASKSSKLPKKPACEPKVLAPAANKAQVIKLITAELNKHEVITEDMLRASIEQTLVDTGHSRMGFSLRFREALSDPRFVHGATGVSFK